jgi:hypothetical protein
LQKGWTFSSKITLFLRKRPTDAAKLATITTSIEEAVTDAYMIQESGPDSIEIEAFAY